MKAQVKITLGSHFRYSAELYQYTDGKFVLVAESRENTWHDDGDGSRVITVDDAFKGCVAHRGQHGDWVEPIGFTQEELSAPVQGAELLWYADYGQRRFQWCQVSSFKDTLQGVLYPLKSTAELINSAYETEPLKGRLTAYRVGFEWGDQAAAHWLVVDEAGSLVDQVSGVGEDTPHIRGGKFTSEREDREEFWKEVDAWWPRLQKLLRGPERPPTLIKKAARMGCPEEVVATWASAHWPISYGPLRRA